MGVRCRKVSWNENNLTHRDSCIALTWRILFRDWIFADSGSHLRQPNTLTMKLFYLCWSDGFNRTFGILSRRFFFIFGGRVCIVWASDWKIGKNCVQRRSQFDIWYFSNVSGSRGFFWRYTAILTGELFDFRNFSLKQDCWKMMYILWK